MPPRPHPDPPPFQDAIAALTQAFNDFRANQDLRNETHFLSVQALQNQLQELQQNQSLMQQTLSTPQHSQASHSQTNNNFSLKPPKIILAPFDGSNPLEWIFQAEQYFTHYSINPNSRISLIASYMAGDALAWFQWLHNNHLLTTWERFCRDLELRFGPSSFENHQQALFKLKKTTYVHEYQKEFEKLCNRVHDLPQIAI